MSAPGFTFSIFHLHHRHPYHTRHTIQHYTNTHLPIHTLTHRSISWSRKPGLSAMRKGYIRLLTILLSVISTLWSQPLSRPWPTSGCYAKENKLVYNLVIISCILPLLLVSGFEILINSINIPYPPGIGFWAGQTLNSW